MTTFVWAIGVSISNFIKPTVNTNDNKRGWELDLNRVALSFSQSSLSNQRIYANFSDSNLKGNSQLSLQFFLTFNASYYARRFVVFNSIAGEYGFTEVRQDNNLAIFNKNLDKFLVSTDYTQRIWDFDLRFESFEMGPYIKFAYQSEFIATPGIGRRQIFTYALGAKLFDGLYIRNFYIDMFGEHDVNPNIALNSLGIETGVELEYKFNKDVRWLYLTNFKQYLFNGANSLIKPQYQFLLETRIDAKLFKRFSISPLLRYYILKAENIGVSASNLVLGVSFNFGVVLLAPNQAIKGVYDFSN